MSPPDLIDELDDSKAVSSRFVQDPIHGYICIRPRLKTFVDTRQFQRMRYIKQLGTSYYVWPGASHNRFEHCLGTAYLARQMTEHLQANQPELSITDRDIECVEIAGLCHDLGHGPWSHVWDSHFIPRAMEGTDWKHEEGSELMLDYLVNDNNIQITEDDLMFVKALIAGTPGRCSRPEKPFLFEIVNNSRNGIDVDKFDYISRDTHAIGDKGNLSLARLIQSSRVIDNQICYDIKDANQIYELCYTRFSLHKRIYNHKTAKAIEYMIIDALLIYEKYSPIARKVFKPEEYVHLTDDIMLRIEATNDPELAEARALLDRIRTRDLYKLVDYKVFDWDDRDHCVRHITPESIVEAAKKLNDTKIAQSLEPKHVIVNLSPMHYGMQEKNPLDFVKFYSKRKPNECASPSQGDISLLMPASFAEVLLRVYTRDVQYYGIIQAGYRAVLKVMPELIGPTLESPSSGPVVLSPPATEIPSTPRPFLRNLSSASLTSTIEDTPLKTFSNNTFTTVPPTFGPPTPTRGAKKAGNKRDRGGVESGASPPRKKGSR